MGKPRTLKGAVRNISFRSELVEHFRRMLIN